MASNGTTRPVAKAKSWAFDLRTDAEANKQSGQGSAGNSNTGNRKN